MHSPCPLFQNFLSSWIRVPSTSSFILSLSLFLSPFMESLLASHQLPEGSSRLLFNPGLEAESAWIKPEVFQIENMLDFSYDDDDKIMLITGFTAVNYNCQPEKPNITKDGEKRNEQKYNGQSDEALEEDTEYYRYVLMKELEWPINIMQESNCLNYPSFKLPEERRQGGSSPSSVLLGHSQHQLEQYTTTISATTTTTTTKEEEEEKEQEEEGNFFLRPCFHSARKLIVVSKARSKRARPSSSGARAWSYMAPILHRHNTFLSSLSSDLVQFESQSSCTTIEVDREEDGKNEGDEDECYVHDLDSLPPAKRSKKKTKKKIMFSNEVGQHQLSPPPPLPTTTSCNTNTRRCSHCLTQKTPQWRAGPEGPKTLCNACGVRYKSGRLLPEYRPAGSPTFVSWVHSNSHRKILEMRRLRQEEETHPFPSPSLTHHHHHHHHQEEEEEESEGGGSNDILLMSNYIGVMIDST